MHCNLRFSNLSSGVVSRFTNSYTLLQSGACYYTTMSRHLHSKFLRLEQPEADSLAFDSTNYTSAITNGVSQLLDNRVNSRSLFRALPADCGLPLQLCALLSGTREMAIDEMFQQMAERLDGMCNKISSPN